MCGVYLRVFNNSMNQSILDFDSENIKQIALRGPDELVTHENVNLNIMFGFSRLAIRSLNSGKQPFIEERFTSAFNGEVYNYDQLKTKIESTFPNEFVPESDTHTLGLFLFLFGPQSISDVIGMVVSTGVGGGIVLNNKLVTGRLGNAGHIGHVIVEPDGRLCECGAHGCLEAHVSGRSIEAITGKSSEHATNEVRIEAGKLVGRALVSVGALMDLQLCVIGGSVALGFGAPFFNAVQRELDRSARIEFIRGMRVLPVGLGDAAPLIGAASLARSSY